MWNTSHFMKYILIFFIYMITYKKVIVVFKDVNNPSKIDLYYRYNNLG